MAAASAPPRLAALSRPQGLPRHGGDVDLGDAARDHAGTPGASVGRAGDRSANPRALARLVAFDLYRRPLRAVAKAAFVPPLDIAGLPVSLLDRFAGDIEQKLTALLRFLGPLTGGASAMRAF